MVQILLLLEVLFTQNNLRSKICPLVLPEPSLFFSRYLSDMGFKPVQDDFQHNFARMTDEADNNTCSHMGCLLLE